MKLQTPIPLKPAHNQIDYKSQLLLLGSCFSENMGRKLEYFQFQSLQNPFGILFHPKAIENLIERAVGKKSYTETDIFFMNERWQCFEAHSDFSDTSKERLLTKLNTSLDATLAQLKRASHVVITLGTAWIYRYLASDSVVANCHKVPQKEFAKELLSTNEIVSSLQAIVDLVKSVNQNVQFIFTISPVRHLKDGFVENQRSKALLINAVHEILEVPSSGASRLFPSYELMMDELRDYRFYGADMVHPNQLAIDYIWEKFKQAWISESVYKTMDEVKTIRKGLEHRPFNPDSAQHLKFKKSLENKMIGLQQRFSFMKFVEASQQEVI